MSDTDGFDTPDYSNHPILKRPGFAAFRHRDYRLYFISRATAVFAVDLTSATLFFQLWRITGNPLVYSAGGLLMFIPMLALFPICGLAADKFPRTRIMFGCANLQLICLAGLIYLTNINAAFPWFIPIILGLAVARAFQMPAQQAIVPVLVPAKHLANAIAWQSTGFQTARVIGWGTSGFLMAAGEALGMFEQIAYMTAFGILVVTAIVTYLIKAKAQIISKDPFNFTTVSAGIRFSFTRPVILGSIGLDLFSVLLGSAKALMPIFVTDVLFIEKIYYGFLQGSLVTGSLLCMLALTQSPIRRLAGKKLFAAVVIFGLGTIIFGLSTNFWISMAALFLVGAGDSVSIFVRNSILQPITPDDMRGRVNAVNSLFINASNEMGDAESGAVAYLFGPVGAVVIGGVGTIVVALSFVKIFPQLWNVDSLDPDDLVAKYRDVSPKPSAAQT